MEEHEEGVPIPEEKEEDSRFGVYMLPGIADVDKGSLEGGITTGPQEEIVQQQTENRKNLNDFAEFLKKFAGPNNPFYASSHNAAFILARQKAYKRKGLFSPRYESSWPLNDPEFSVSYDLSGNRDDLAPDNIGVDSLTRNTDRYTLRLGFAKDRSIREIAFECSLDEDPEFLNEKPELREAFLAYKTGSRQELEESYYGIPELIPTTLGRFVISVDLKSQDPILAFGHREETSEDKPRKKLEYQFSRQNASFPPKPGSSTDIYTEGENGYGKKKYELRQAQGLLTDLTSFLALKKVA